MTRISIKQCRLCKKRCYGGNGICELCEPIEREAFDALKKGDVEKAIDLLSTKEIERRHEEMFKPS